MSKRKGTLIILIIMVIMIGIPFYMSAAAKLYTLSVITAFIEAAIVFGLIAHTILKTKSAAKN